MTNVIATGTYFCTYCLRLWYTLVLMALSGTLMSVSSMPGTPEAPYYRDRGNLRLDNQNIVIQETIKKHQKELYFPHTVERFYNRNGNQLIWVLPETVKSHGWEALLLLDCVLQFGLNHNDYHPVDLLTIRMHEIIKNYTKVSDYKKALFDVFLTDGIITFMNHLHYGKLNPYVRTTEMDQRISGSLADMELEKALHSADFMTAVLSVQPQSQEYQLLKSHMRLVTGQYIGDCYEVPAVDIRKMAINLERLRWINMEEKSYIHINLPNFILKLKLPDTVYQFKTIIGKQAYPTPILQSEIVYFTTAPDWRVPTKIFLKEILPKAIHDSDYLDNNHFAIYNRKGDPVGSSKADLKAIKRNPANYYVTQSSGCENSLGQLVFHFKNNFDIYLHDTPEKQLFNKNKRVFSHGCIRVEHAGILAELLLLKDGSGQQIPAMQHAIANHHKMDFRLNKAVPIKITYLTCEVVDGIVVMYDDIYQLDPDLEHAIYHSK